MRKSFDATTTGKKDSARRSFGTTGSKSKKTIGV